MPPRDPPASLAARFDFIERLGDHRGAKEVWLAADRQGGPDVVIVRIVCGNAAKLQHEIAQIQRLDSRYVPRIFDLCVEPRGTWFDAHLVVEYCEGPTLAQVAAPGALGFADAAPILLELSRALAAIHCAGVLHPELRLDNVMLASGDAGSRLKLLDLGLLARHEVVDVDGPRRDHELAAVLPYITRDWMSGDPRSDVYAFGACCLRILTGEFPLRVRKDEDPFAYMERRCWAPTDLSALPAELPATAVAVIDRMLDLRRDHRPYMPEVVAAFERAFGAPLLPATAPIARPRHVQRRPLPLVRAHRVDTLVESPEQLLVAACPHAPFVTLTADGWDVATHVRAIAPDGTTRWQRRLDGHLATGVRVDLDHDGVREVYVAGRGGVAALDAQGELRFAVDAPASLAPGLIAVADPVAPWLAVDGERIDIATGAGRGRLPQVFDGPHGTAAVIQHAGDPWFWVARLEAVSRGQIELAIYGPDGARLHGLAVVAHRSDAGDPGKAGDRTDSLLGPDRAPLAVLGERGTAAVLVPLLAPHDPLPPTLVGFELPSGRELWRRRLVTPGGRAVLADLEGNGRPSLVVGDGGALVGYDAWTGEPTAPLPSKGLPVAFGDPLATGFAHLITVRRSGIALWRGPRCQPGAMAWTGARGDLWRSGVLRLDGHPLGPV